MQKTPYPREQMHRIAYHKLSSQQIARALAPAVTKGPDCASPLSDLFAGRTMRIVTDKGPTLAYHFRDDRHLSLSESGAPAINAAYGALTLGSVAILAHLIPGTQRGYAVVVDSETNLATVFELWFSGYTDNREVQRAIHYGYVEQSGQPAPTARHAATNRVEGKGYHWTQDNGIETLEFYPSSAYSHFVELTRLGGELGFCGPSDYVQINDDLYAYTRTECEFSGTFTCYVMDLNRTQQIGLRLGFNAADALEYYLFRGQGEWLGQVAHFEKLGDVSGDPVPPPSSAKGARAVYRPLEDMPKMTKAQVDAAVAKSTSVFPEPPGPMAGNSMPTTDWLAGKVMTMRYDGGLSMAYRFDDAQTLHWRREGTGGWTSARYQAWESMPGVIMFGHLLEGAPNHDGHILVADFRQGLVTCLNGYLNTPYFANEAGVRTMFGVIDMPGLIAPHYRRHHFTDELLGHVLSWHYSPGLTSMHLYSTPHTMSWIIFTDSGAGGLEWSGPAGYVKIRDGLYLMHWLEEACNGTLGTILINLRTMHDVGMDYHCGEDGLRLGQIGAISRHAGRFDVRRFYQIGATGDVA